MHALTKVGDYEVRDPVFVAGLVRYQATHVLLPRCATIEMLDVGAPRSAAIRLMRHACILEALRHPGVPRVFECGLLDGRPWVAFERSEGLSLEVELRSHRLTVHEVLGVVEQVAGTLAYAHARGVLHRNISPAALIRDPQRGQQLVLHRWGNACTHDTDLPGPLRGTTRYRAPELIIHDRPADGRADVYSLGAIALHALQGIDTEQRAHDLRAQPAALAKLLESMIADDMMLRPTAAEVLAAIGQIRRPADDSDVVLLDKARAKPRWTPQWGLGKTAPHGIVEIMPRRRRTATDVDER